MSTLSHSESSRLYSWWWDSHISPKNSKWLQENLTDMDAKVKAMIKLIEEDADSFARRAEMYYKKRPELIKLVEEFYRAYRALAERYDYATGELRQAHRTMAKAFPDQAPFVFADESSSVSADGTEPHIPESPLLVHSFFDLDHLDKEAPRFSASDQHSVSNESYSGDSDAIISKKGLRQQDGMFGSGVVQGKVKSTGGTQKGLNHDLTEKEEVLHNELSKLLNENQKLNAKVLSEFERASKAESEVQYMKKALTDMQAVKEAVQSQYQQNIEKLASLKGELISVEKDSRRLNEQASKAETEFLSLKEAITKLEAEKDALSSKNKDCLEKISNLEVIAFRAQANEKELEERTIKAEMETQFSNKELFRVESEKEANLHQYKQCLEKISDLEKKVFVAEADARHLKQQAEGAETEVAKLKVILAEVTARKEATALQYKVCLEKISNLENEISSAQEEIRFLKNEILSGATKLKTAEDKCDLLEMSNQTLRLEADNLVLKIALKDKVLSEKHEELEKLQVSLQEERSRYDHVEATLHSLQNMHSQSQEDQRTLTLELQNGLQMLKDLEISKHGLEEEIRQIKDENYILKEQSSSSTMSMKDLQNEILGLTRIKEGFEVQVGMQLGKIDALQNETFCLKEEIFNLNKSYQSLVKQVEIVGLDPKSFGTTVKELQDENSSLRQTSEKDKEDKEIVFKKLVNMVELLEKNAALQSSLSDVTSDLEGSLEKAKVLQESCNVLHGEKSALVAEKAALISQVKLMTENLQELFEKNTVLESSLFSANSELESLRKKSKSLEELNQLLGNEKASLVTERSMLAAQLEIVERRLYNLEKRFTEFEGNYAGSEKEKNSSHSPLEELMFSFGVEKHERESLKQWSESRLASLEKQITLLQEESKQSKKEFQDELDKSVSSQFEIHVLQKFVQDMEEKNYSLLTECQKQIETSKLAENLISELENENLEQQVEEELLLATIEKLRSGVHQVLKALEIDANCDLEKLSEDDHISVHHILEGIAIMKNSLLEYKDDMQQLTVENSVLLTLLEQLRVEGLEAESEKNNLANAYKTMSEQFSVVQSEREKLLDMNEKLRSEASMGNHHVKVLIAEVQSLTMKQAGVQSAYLELEEKYSQTFEESKSLSRMFSDLKKTNIKVDEENDAVNVIQDMLTFDNLSTIFSSLRTHAGEFKLLLEDFNKLNDVNSELVDEVNNLREELGMLEIEKLFMKDIVEKLEMDLSDLIDLNSILKQEISNTKDFLNQGEKELFDAEMKLAVTENLNSEMCRAMDGLKKEYEKSESIREYLEIQMLKLSKDDVNQHKNIQHLLEVKGNLESELAMLREEIEERRNREENLNSELQESRNEFEFWDAEAETFYFNLQVSTIREFLFEDKVHELSGVCQNLLDENSLKIHEVESLKERISFQVDEDGGLKSQLHGNSPAVMSLKENIETLDAWAKLVVASNQTPKDMDLDFQGHVDSCQQSADNQDSSRQAEILELQKLQNRIKATEKVVVEEMNRLAMRDNENFKSESRSVEGKAKQMEGGRIQDEPSNNVKLQKTKPEVPEVKNGVLMKDILLDQASDSSLYGKSRRRNSLPASQIRLYRESAENNHRVDQNLIELQKQRNEPSKKIVHNDIECVEQQIENPSSELDLEKELGVDKLQVSTSTSTPSRGGNKKKILERLASDGQKLANIQTNLQDLRRKLETNKKSRSTKNVDLETVKEQLIEAEETVVQLINLNGQMTRKVEDIPVSKEAQRSTELDKAASFQRKKVSEQARKESEKIGRLQLEIQKIQYLLLQAEEGKKSKGRNRFSMTKSRTTIILRDFIHSGNRSSARQKKGRLCGCFKPSSTNTGGNVTM